MALRLLLQWVIAVIMLAISCETSEAAKRIALPPRFPFTIDPKTPLKDLLPPVPAQKPRLPAVLNEDLAATPELIFTQPLKKDMDFFKSQETLAHQMAKINHLNQQKEDGFLNAFRAQRDDLRGLPFLLGKECRTERKRAALFASVARILQNQLSRIGGERGDATPEDIARKYWQMVRGELGKTDEGEAMAILRKKYSAEEIDRALVAVWMQTLTPMPPAYRLGLVRQLSKMAHADAGLALARLALYAPEGTVRDAAIDALKTRKDAGPVEFLLTGFQYPWPPVASRAADALVKLHAKHAAPKLVDVLEQPDPRAVSVKKVDGREVSFIREVVRINHHHNCVLCHAPANTPDVPQETLTAPSPVPSQPLPTPFQGYGSRLSPDIFVRVDMTYLRQDFSMMMKVDNAKPWPEMQRFDFFVRTREVNASEAEQRGKELARTTPPNHAAAQKALQALTGQTPAPDATPQTWRRLLEK